jgi:hypothetical protein
VLLEEKLMRRRLGKPLTEEAIPTGPINEVGSRPLWDLLSVAVSGVKALWWRVRSLFWAVVVVTAAKLNVDVLLRSQEALTRT